MKLAAQVENTDSPAADFKKTIHSLLLRTDEQLEALSKATEASDLPTMAYATRNLLELMVWSVYVLKSNDNTKRFAQDWVLDGIGIGCGYFGTTLHRPGGWSRCWSFSMWKDQ